MDFCVIDFKCLIHECFQLSLYRFTQVRLLMCNWIIIICHSECAIFVQTNKLTLNYHVIKTANIAFNCNLVCQNNHRNSVCMHMQAYINQIEGVGLEEL